MCSNAKQQKEKSKRSGVFKETMTTVSSILDTTISYKDHVTNKEVRAKIQQAIGPHEDLLNIVKRRKLWWLSLIHI